MARDYRRSLSSANIDMCGFISRNRTVVDASQSIHPILRLEANDPGNLEGGTQQRNRRGRDSRFIADVTTSC